VIVLFGLLGEEIELPEIGRETSIGVKEISKSWRSLYGTLRSDVILTKKQFTYSYNLCDIELFEALEEIYAIGGELSLYHYISSYEFETYTVVMEPIQYTKEVLQTNSGSWLIKSLSVKLEEV